MIRAWSRSLHDWFGDLPLRTKGSIIILGPAGILSLLVWILVSLVFLYRSAQESSARSLEILAEVHAVEARLFESLASFRAYLSRSTSNELLTRHLNSRRELESRYIKILNRIKENDQQDSTWRPVVQKLQELERLLDSVIDDKPAGSTNPTANRAEIIAQIERAVVQARSVLEIFRQEESRLSQSRLNVLETRQRLITVLAIIGILSSLAIMAATWRVFSQGLLAQLNALRRNLEEYRAGEPFSSFPYHRDELGMLAIGFREVAGLVRQKDFEIQNFVYSVSHDLRSPLVNLEGFTKELELSLKILREKLDSAEEARNALAKSILDDTMQNDINPALGFIRAAVRRLASIVDGLLRLSRLGQLDLHFEDLNINELFGELISTCRNPVAPTLEVTIAPDVPRSFVSDRYSIEQIFGNLLSNACKYLRAGVPGTVEVGVSEEHSDRYGTCFFVRDNGVGIPSMYREKVFKMFERLHPDLAPGEGMGLAFVQRVVVKLNGRIWFASAPNEGSTFYVYLPDMKAVQPQDDVSHIG